VESSTPSSRSSSIIQNQDGLVDLHLNQAYQVSPEHSNLGMSQYFHPSSDWYPTSYHRTMYLGDQIDQPMDFVMQDPSVVHTSSSFPQNGMPVSSVESLSINPAHLHPDMSSMTFPHGANMIPGDESSKPGNVTRLEPHIDPNSTESRTLLSWPCIQCNPVTDETKVPQKPRDFLENLRACLQNSHVWDGRYSDSPSVIESSISYQVVPLTNTARDRLVVLVQSVLHQSLDGTASPMVQNPKDNGRSKFPAFVMLPSSEVLNQFIQTACAQCGAHFGLIPGRIFDPSKLLMQSEMEEVTGLLVLLIIAQGARSTETPEGQALSDGLIEVCRIMLHEHIDHGDDTPLAQDILHCSVLLLHLSAWSGHRWQMSVSVHMIRLVR
jgi:hypothetical protein